MAPGRVFGLAQAEPSLTKSGIFGPLTRAYPDTDVAHHGPETPRRLHLLFAVLGTDLRTGHGESDANKPDVLKQVG